MWRLKQDCREFEASLDYLISFKPALVTEWVLVSDMETYTETHRYTYTRVHTHRHYTQTHIWDSYTYTHTDTHTHYTDRDTYTQTHTLYTHAHYTQTDRYIHRHYAQTYTLYMDTPRDRQTHITLHTDTQTHHCWWWKLFWQENCDVVDRPPWDATLVCLSCLTEHMTDNRWENGLLWFPSEAFSACGRAQFMASTCGRRGSHHGW